MKNFLKPSSHSRFINLKDFKISSLHHRYSRFFTCLMAFMSLSFSIHAAEAISLNNKIKSCTYSAAPLKAPKDSDTNMMLLDKKSRDEIIWYFRSFNYQPLELKFNFSAPVKLETVKINYSRWKQAFGITKISVAGEKADGEKIALGSIAPNQPYEVPSEEKGKACFEIPLNKETSVISATLIFEAASYVSIGQIDFLGE